MEFNLHKRKKLTSVLKASIYKVHDRIEFASVTRHLLILSREQKDNLLLDDIRYGSPFKLRPVTTVCKVWVPSLEALESEKILGRQRLEKVNFQRQLAQQIELDLKRDSFLARRPLPPYVPWMPRKDSLWY